MRTFIKSSLVWSGMLLSGISYGQSGANAPLGVLPMEHNSSFAGEAQSPRISSNTMIGYHPVFSGNYFGTYNSYDQFIPAIRSGIGITGGWYTQSVNHNDLSFRSGGYSIGLALAPKFSINGRYTISPSVDFTYNRGEVTTESTNFPHLNQQVNLSRSRIGLLFNTNKYYIGYSVHVFNRLQVNDENFGPLWMGYQSVLQAGYTFQRNAESNFSFTPQIAIRIAKDQGPERVYFDFFEAFNLNFRYKEVLWGINNTGFHLGWQTERLRLMLSSNAVLHRYANYRFGSTTTSRNDSRNFNLSIRYILSKDRYSRW